MATISKRVFSWLVVLAMVLSMVPVLNLSNFALITRAAENETAGQANLPAGTQAIIDAAKDIQDADLAAHIAAGTCPVCGEGVTWKTKTNNSGSWDIGITATDTKYHFYIDGNNADSETGLIYSGHYNFAQTKAEGQTLCIALINNPTVDLDGYIRNSKKNCEINIMGQGTIKSDGKKADGVTDASEDLGMLLFQGGDSTFNIYGGTYIYTGDGDGTKNNANPTYGAISMRNAGNVLNIFDGVVIGSATQDRTKHQYNIVLGAGTINMYGGTIQNGVTGYTSASGNVNVGEGTIFNMYGGIIKNGSAVLDANASAYLQKAGASGSSIASIGGNVRVSSGTFNMYGGSLENGYARNGGNGGGNLGTLAGGKANILGGTIKGGTAAGNGDNINVVSGTVTISGTALIESGEEGDKGSIYLSKDATGAKLVVEGGTIRGGQNKNSGGNINAGAKTTVQITGGLIENGHATKQGGNIYLTDGCNATISGSAIIRGGVAEENGGNISSAIDLTVSATILDGTSRKGGGNINMGTGKTLTVAGGVIANGWVTGAWDEATNNYKPNGSNWGGNIRIWCGTLKVTDGLIYGGKHGPNGTTDSAAANIGCLASMESTATQNLAGSTLEISGGIIVGDINTSAPSKNADGTATCPGTSVKLSGSPKILKSYTLENGTTVQATNAGLNFGGNANGTVTADVSELSQDAQIVVSVSKGRVFATNAAAVKNCFTAYSAAYVVTANENGDLSLTDKPEPAVGVFAPEQFDGMAYCDACLAQGKSKENSLVKWTAYNGENYNESNRREEYIDGKINYNAHFHLYLAEDQTYNNGSFFVTYRSACINLNGHNITAGENGTNTFSASKILNVFDSEGGAVVTGNGVKNESGAVFHANGAGGAATYSIYGGTFTKVEGNTVSPIVLIGANGGTVKMYGGQIGLGNEVYNGVPAVYLIGSDLAQNSDGSNHTNDGPAAFTLYGGKIYGGTHTGKAGGAVRVGSINASGDGIKARNYDSMATFTMIDGEIIGGEARYGGTIWVGKKNTFIMEGGKIHGGEATASGGNFHVEANCTVTISGGEIYDGVVVGEVDSEGKVTSGSGGNLHVNSGTQFTISGNTKIYDGVARTVGGNINTNAVTTISGNVLIDNGEAQGQGGGNIHYGNTTTITGATIQNGKATAATGASGGNLRGSGNLTVTDSTVKNGYVADSATGGGNIYATSGKSVTINGGTWEGGTAKNGGNIYIYNGNLTITGDAVITGGHATNNGGNIYKYGGDTGCGNTKTHFVTIGDNVVVKDGVADGTGGNIYLNASKLTLADNVQVLDGDAKTAGNIYVTGIKRKGAEDHEYAVFVMEGGLVKGGTADNMANANIFVEYANMEMSGGEVYAPDGSEANGAGLRLSSGAALYLTGDAFIGRADGVADCCMQVQPNANVYVAGDWTGSALVQYNEPFFGGDTVVTEEKYYTTWGTFTSATDETTGFVTYTFNQGNGEAYTGTLIQERAPFAPIVPQSDGTVKIATAGVISAEGATWYETNEEALADYEIENDLYIFMSGEATIDEDIRIDMGGSNLTLSGSGMVYGLDSRNDGFSGYGVITIAEDAEIEYVTDAVHPENGNRYIAIKEGNELSFHRIVMEFTHVTLRTEDAGIYYKANFQADKLLASKIYTFGSVLSLNDMPGADFEYEAGNINIATELSGDRFVSGAEITTASVYGIVKESRSKEENAALAQMDIYANLYLRILEEDGTNTIIMADNGTEETAAGGVAYSLIDVLGLINESWESFSAEEQATVQTALTKWAAFITDDAVAQLQVYLNKIFG